MAIDGQTIRMIEAYTDEAEAPQFLSGFYRSPPQNFHSSEKVAIDIEREDEEVAIVLQSMSAGARHNENSVYTDKAFTPPVFNESGAVNSFNMLKRQLGQEPFQNPNFLENARQEIFRGATRLVRKIRRSIELMISQIFQTGTVTLTDNNGVALYTLDFQMKSAHKVSVGVAWPSTNYDPVKDIGDTAEVVRRNGKKNPTDLIFGSLALRDFMEHAGVQKLFDNRNMELGNLAPQTRGGGATYVGRVWIRNYWFRIWSYDGTYKHPQTGVITPYVAPSKIIMLSEGARYDLTYGAIPLLRRSPEAESLLPARISSTSQGIDLNVNAYYAPDGRNFMYEVGTRPLPIPTAIDTYACIETRP